MNIRSTKSIGDILIKIPKLEFIMNISSYVAEKRNVL